MLHASDYETQQQVEAASRYLTNNRGNMLELSSEQLDAIAASLDVRTTDVSNLEMAQMNARGFATLQNDVRAGFAATEAEIRAVYALVAECHADTVAKLNALMRSIEMVNGNLCTLGDNVTSIAGELVQLRNDFNRYVEADVRATNVQRAETKLIQLNQQLDQQYGHHRDLRRNAIGILEASDLAAIRTDTILTRAEELCIQAPRYWLAPALVALAQWIHASQEETPEARQAMVNMLNEAYRRDREKTALFFGLICRRANHISQANDWFKEYISFQDPRRVDQTCIVLLNAYAAGIMGRGKEEQSILRTMSGWIDELMADPEGRYEQNLINDWKNTCRELYETANTETRNNYPALREFSPSAWPALSATMSATSLHREMRRFLSTELSKKDFREDDLTMIDDMISDLVTDFDADELPIRREHEYQKLIVDLHGNEQTASLLRQIKDDILSETKSFISILSDAARSSKLSSASAATRVHALKVQMPWIKRSWAEVTDDYRNATPRTIPLEMGDYRASTTDGSNEAAVINDYVNHVNRQEQEGLAALSTGNLELGLMIGGGAAAVVGLILGIAVSAIGWVLVVAGIALLGYGFSRKMSRERKQAELSQQMQQKRDMGVTVIREFMKEVREFRAEYAEHELLIEDVASLMDGVIEEASTMEHAFSS